MANDAPEDFRSLVGFINPIANIIYAVLFVIFLITGTVYLLFLILSSSLDRSSYYGQGVLGIFTGVIASSIWTVILFILIFLIPLSKEVFWRKDWQRFFGMGEAITIYMSAIYIENGGTRPLVPGPGYDGPAVCRIEYASALTIREKLGNKRIKVVPKFVYDLIGKYTFSYEETAVVIHLSWLPEIHKNNGYVLNEGSPKLNDVAWIWETFEKDYFWTKIKIKAKQPIIILGSDVYNSLTKYYLDVYAEMPENKLFYSGFPKFIENKNKDGRDIVFIHNTGDSRPNDGVELARDYFRCKDKTDSTPPIDPAFIARFRDRGYVTVDKEGNRGIDRESSSVGRTVIICAGPSDQSTAASVMYLIANWQALGDEFKEDDFAIFLSYDKFGGFGASGDSASPNRPPETARDIKLEWIKRRNLDTYRLHIAGEQNQTMI